MASLTFPPLVPPTVPAGPAVQPVVPALPAAGMLADTALPFSLPQAVAAPAVPAPPGAAAPDMAAMRPDQVMMARQMHFPATDGQALASSWRGMVRSYASELVRREQQARAGQLPAALLAAGQHGAQRGIDPATILPDAWRFTVHGQGQREQHLVVVTGEPDPRQGRRRRARAALRLELELDDGTRVVVQAEPLPGGILLDLCAENAPTLRRLRALQPELEAVLEGAGLRVLRWKFRDRFPAGVIHARMPSGEAAGMLSLPVFRAMAELALLLPALPPHKD